MFRTAGGHAACPLLVAALLLAPCDAREIVLTLDSDLESATEAVTAGDVIILEDGVWTDAELTLDSLPGTADAPIRIRPETPGGVVFAGASQFRFSGAFVTVSGFVFRDVSGVSDVVQLRTHSRRHARNCRITDCVFEQTPDAEAGSESKWLSVYGSRNRVDHCFFGGKRSRGPTLVVWVAEDSGRHRIDHNHFGPRPELGRNGGETIRVGTSDVSELDCGTVVEDNYFHKCDGEAEVISNKSCGNVYRGNVFDACSGALTLRHGHRCVVNANVFLGRQARGTGGVRIIGRDHVVTNNYFEGLRGDGARAAICLMNGIPGGPLNGYAPVRRAVIAHNTLVDCKVTFEFGLGAGRTQSAAPTDCRIAHNLVSSGKWPMIREYVALANPQWIANCCQLRDRKSDHPTEFQAVTLDWKRGVGGLLRPTETAPLITPSASEVSDDIDGLPRANDSLAGCDDPTNRPRDWPADRNTGPTWSRLTE